MLNMLKDVVCTYDVRIFLNRLFALVRWNNNLYENKYVHQCQSKKVAQVKTRTDSHIEVVLFTYSIFRIKFQPQMHKENKSYVTRRTLLSVKRPNPKIFQGSRSRDFHNAIFSAEGPWLGFWLIRRLNWLPQVSN